MKDGPIPMIVAVAAAVSLCSVCVLGPATVGALAAGVLGWLGGAGPVLTVVALAGVGALLFLRLRSGRGRGRRPDASGDQNSSADRGPHG